MTIEENGSTRLGMDSASLSEDLRRHFHVTLGRDAVGHSRRYLYQALGLTVRDRRVER